MAIELPSSSFTRTRETFYIFLGSPGDLPRERKITAQVVGAVNLAFRTSPVQLELMTWEQLAPGTGRAQAQINQYVNRCDLFIGLLNRKWGTPTGEYSSGFEEEFRLADARSRASGSPEIWLAFRSTKAAEEQDPGPELTKIIAFRKEQESTPRLLFKQFKNAQAWERQLTSWLTEFLYLQAAKIEKERAQDHQSGSPLPGQVVPQPQSSETIRSLHTVLSRIASQENSSSEDETSQMEVGRAELYLLASDLFLSETTGGVLGVHEANLLFKHRASIAASASSSELLTRSMLNDENSVVPGWFWLRGVSSDAAKALLLRLSSLDRMDSVRIGALAILRRSQFVLSPSEIQDLPLDDKSLEVRSAAFDCLADLADLNQLSRFEAEPEKTRSDEFKAARSRFLVRVAPQLLINEILLKGSADRIDYQESKILRTADSATLSKAITVENEEVRSIAAEMLFKRGELDEQKADRLKTDSGRKAQLFAFFVLARGGYHPSEEEQKQLKGSWHSALSGLFPVKGAPSLDDITLEYFSHKSYEELVSLVTWYGGNGRTAYEALARYQWPRFKETVRSDLASDFTRIVEENDQRLIAAGGVELAVKVREDFGDLYEFIRSQFRVCALRAMSLANEAQDLVFFDGLEASDEEQIRTATARMLIAHATQDSVSRLISLAKSSSGEWRLAAALKALEVAGEPKVLAEELLRERSDVLTKAVLGWMQSQEEMQAGLGFRLLNSNNDSDRIQAVKYFLMKRDTDDSLELLLNAYLSKHTYFYNVAVWLDKVLYSPEPLRTAFRKQLLSM